LSVTVQPTFDVIVNVAEEAAEGSETAVGETVRLLDEGATCVTATVRVRPPPVTVTVPVRDAVPVFADALIVNEPLFDPEVGDTVIQL